jgi:hypothetical protein
VVNLSDFFLESFLQQQETIDESFGSILKTSRVSQDGKEFNDESCPIVDCFSLVVND